MTGAAAGGAVPYYTSPSGDVVLHQGDALAVLRALPAGSAHVCITSPPYWNLRDYQTGGWEGGDESCDHVSPPRRGSGTYSATSTLGPNRDGLGPENAAWRVTEQQYRAVCGKCGARRVDAQIGLEATVGEYVEKIVAVFREIHRVLHPTGTCWANFGDSYAGVGRGPSTSSTGERGLHTSALQGGALGGAWDTWRPPPAGTKAKDLLMIPSRVAIALRDDGWWLRAMIPWLKRSAMPESATDRPTTATEYLFLLSKASSYFYDATAVALPGTPYRVKQPDGWDTGSGGHGSFHRNGRERGSTRDGERSGRNRRNADWWFDSLRAILAGATGLLADEDGEPLALPVNPAAYPGAHFATFAPKLVEPMVLASTSARGACPACLTPWVRQVEKAYRSPIITTGTEEGRYESGRNRNVVRMGDGVDVTTTGWRAGCACDAGPPIPCTVLDPFCGSGTVSLVARKHGRHSWGIDLSAAYLDMARGRLGQLALPLTGG